MGKVGSSQGYTLIELALVLVIIGILASIGLKSLTAVNQTSRIENTRQELDRLAYAIAGDPSLTAGGARSSFGYVGDVGGLPPNLDALVANPGGWATWNGPYITDQFSSGGGNSDFKYDAWGSAYTYAGGNTIRSTGGGLTLTRELAHTADDLLRNRVNLVVTDLDHTPPGSTYADSVVFMLSVPNGSGGVATRTRKPRADGYAAFDSIPIGVHDLRMVYLPTADTLTRRVVVEPGASSYVEISLAEDRWTGN